MAGQRVGRIRALAPARVLEIGCGTGMALLRVAPECERYVATDLSGVAVTALREEVVRRRLDHVAVLERPAHDFTGFETEGFDAIVLNSVVQYFPDLSYVLAVIRKAIGALAPSGALFLGDVRSFPLLQTLHTSVELERAPGALPTAELARRVSRRISEEQELVLDPRLFTDLAAELPELADVRVELKRGHRHNELASFRYDVTLRRAPSGGGRGSKCTSGEHGRDPRWPMLDWERDGLSLDRLRNITRARDIDALTIVRVPNARLTGPVHAVELLSGPDPPPSAGALREAVADAVRAASAVDPEDFWAIGEELGWHADVGWSGSGADGGMDLTLVRDRNAVRAAAPSMASHKPGRATARFRGRANDPLRTAVRENLVPELRELAASKLPDYMIPSAFTVMDAFPLTRNGKLDRGALPAPDARAGPMGRDFVAPRTDLERRIAQICGQVTGLEEVGIDDNFFTELGGNSLLATQLVARIRAAMDIEIPLTLLFQTPTVRGLALAAGDPDARFQRDRDGPVRIVRTSTAQILEQVDELSEQEIDELLAQLDGEPGGSGG